MLHPRQFLFIGNNSRPFCQEMIDLGYTGMAFTIVSDALHWIPQQLKYGELLPDIILCDTQVKDASALSLFYSLNK